MKLLALLPLTWLLVACSGDLPAPPEPPEAALSTTGPTEDIDGEAHFTPWQEIYEAGDLATAWAIVGDPTQQGYGYTPLWSAAVKGDEEMTLWLLERGADPQIVPTSGDLPDLARQAGH